MPTSPHDTTTATAAKMNRETTIASAPTPTEAASIPTAICDSKKGIRVKTNSSSSSNNNNSSSINVRYRLLSICHDVDYFVKPLLQSFQQHTSSMMARDWPIVSNERCGTWYFHPTFLSPNSKKGSINSCYFKSTDGHAHQPTFSYNRLNLNLATYASQYNGCFIIDATLDRRCVGMPDSFIRTVPIWCAVLNRLVCHCLRQREEDSKNDRKQHHKNNSNEKCNIIEEWEAAKNEETNPWMELHLPPFLSSTEHDEIKSTLDTHVQYLLQHSIIADLSDFVSNISKPLRPYWICHNDDLNANNETRQINDDICREEGRDERNMKDFDHENYTCIVCVSCSKKRKKKWRCKRGGSGGNTANNSDVSTGIQVFRHKIASTTLYQHGYEAKKESDYGITAGEKEPQKKEGKEQNEQRIISTIDEEYMYIPGAADDHELWSRGLTPTLFWSHRNEILNCNIDDRGVTHNEKQQLREKLQSPTETIREERTKQVIDSIVSHARQYDEEWYLADNKSQDGNSSSFITTALRNLEISSTLASTSHKTTTTIETLSKNPLSSKKDKEDVLSYFNTIGKTHLSVGTRRAGRPPNCWSYFDAIVNVTTLEYEYFSSPSSLLLREGMFYLQLPVKEGKKDRIELERWLPVGLTFIGLRLSQLQQQQQQQQEGKDDKGLLIHCAQGMDRSVALTMAALVLFCQENEKKDDGTNASNGLIVAPWCHRLTLESLSDMIGSSESKHIEGKDTASNIRNNSMSGKYYINSKENNSNNNSAAEVYKMSGMAQRQVDALLHHPNGKYLLFSWIAKIRGFDSIQELFSTNKVTKESLKRTLQIVRQYHERANPTRSTMQKLNRFFLSLSYEK